MTAEPIARVIDDLRQGRVRHLVEDSSVNAVALERVQRADTVVDATAIYWDLHDRLVVKRQGVDVYGDHPSITPPWESAVVGCVNQFGNVVLLQVQCEPWSGWGLAASRRAPTVNPHHVRWHTPNEVDWDRVRWLVETFVWVGGRSKEGPLPTSGPVHLLQYALYDDGEPADLHFVQLLPDTPLDTWEVPQLVLLAALNFLNCKNVELSEPQRKRPERRRLERLGVRVQTLTVRPLSRRSAGASGAQAGAVPLHSVRGHFAEYGERYGKGKLFGKLEGRYWIPAHARGSADEGEVRKDYELRP